MAKSNELTDFYFDELNPDLQKLEKDRKNIASKLIFIGIGLFALAIFISLFFKSGDEIIFWPFILGFVLFGILKYVLTHTYVAEFKDKVIHPLIKQIDSSLKYKKDDMVSERIFLASKLFKKRIDRYSGNDLVYGEIDGVKLRFSDVNAQYVTKDSKGKTSTHTIFEGLFIVADFNKDFKGQTSVLPDTAEKLFGNMIGSWLQEKNMNRNELIKMDNPEFEKHFVVYGTDQIESRYILTHSMMDRLLTFKKKVSVPLYVSFRKDKIYLALEYNKDLFEPAVFSSLLDYQIVKEYVSTLNLAVGIIAQLKLNENLWSKT